MCDVANTAFSDILQRFAPDLASRFGDIEVDSPEAFSIARSLHASLISEVKALKKTQVASTYDTRVEEELMRRVHATAPQGLTKLLTMSKQAIDREDALLYEKFLEEMDSDGLMAEITDNVNAMIALSRGNLGQARAFRDSFRRTGLRMEGSSVGQRLKLLSDMMRRGDNTRGRKLAAEVTELMAEASHTSMKGGNRSRHLLHKKVRAIAFQDGLGQREMDWNSEKSDDGRRVSAMDVLGGREGRGNLRSIKPDFNKSTFKHYLQKKDDGSLTQLCETALNLALEVDSPVAASIIDLLATSEISQDLRLESLNFNAKTTYVLHKILPLCRHLKEITIVRSSLASHDMAGLIIPMASVLPLVSVSIVEADIKRDSLTIILAAFSRPTEAAAVNPRLSALSRPPRSSSPAGDTSLPSPQAGSPAGKGAGAKHMTGMGPNWWLTLRQFDLSHNASIGDEGFSELVRCLTKLQSLKILKLASIGISDISASNIRELLTSSKLKSLDLSSNVGLRVNTAKAIDAALADGSVQLAELQLNLNEGLYSHIGTLVGSFSSWSSLEKLGLAGVRLDEEDMMSLACMLRFGGARLPLERLDLSRGGDLTTVSGQCLMRQIMSRKKEESDCRMTIETQGCKVEEENINAMPLSQIFCLDVGLPKSRLVAKILAEHEVLGKRLRFNSWTELRIDNGPDLIPLASWRGVEHEGWLGHGLPQKGKIALKVRPLPAAADSTNSTALMTALEKLAH